LQQIFNWCCNRVSADVSLVLLCCFSFFTYRCSGKGRGVASGERDGGCVEVLGVGRGRRWLDPCKLGGSGERVGGRAEVLWRARSAMERIPRTLRAERGPFFFFSWGEPFRAERAHHLDASGRPHASGR
jgi:hypothetical protein